MALRNFELVEEEEVDRVAEWLDELRIEIEQTTPPPPLCERRVYEDVSPTNTTFSSRSVFDKPYRQHRGLGSPGRCRDDDSDATSIDAKQPVSELQVESLHCYDPASEVPYAVQQPSTLSKQNTPRLVTIVSCIQCTLASLPCSRTTPSCTRCIRNNSATSCLLRRRLFLEEVATSPAGLCTVPVLLKLHGTDEDMWAAKMAVMGALMEMWEEKKDRQNWVIPRIESEERGGWKGRKKKVVQGLGEGMGRVRCEELVVEEMTF